MPPVYGHVLSKSNVYFRQNSGKTHLGEGKMLEVKPKGQDHRKNRIIHKETKIFHLLINRAGIHLVTVVQQMSQTGYE